MLNNKLQIYLLFSFLFSAIPSAALTQSKICEIKYNQKVGAQTLERILNIKEKYKYLNEKGSFDCYQIGVEHDKNRRPIINKPIYAWFCTVVNYQS